MTTFPDGMSDAALTASGVPLQAPRAPRSRRAAGDRLLVVLIPALNEEASIGRVVREIPRRVAGFARVEVVVVDDGSDDLTADRAWAAGADHVARHPGNRGLSAAFNSGTSEALARGADVVVTLDADGQHDASHIPELVAPIVEGRADIVVASRPLADGSQGSPARRIGNRVGSWVARRALRVPLSDVTSGYRAFSREALTKLHVTSTYTYTLETLVQAAAKRLRMAEITAPARRRMVGESRMTHSLVRYIGRTGGQAFRTALHTDPLKAFGRAAAGLGLAAVGMTAWFLLAYASGGLHLPELLAALLLALAAGALLVCGLLADGICANRRLLEDTLQRVKRMEAGPPGAVPRVAEPAELRLAVPAVPAVPALVALDAGPPGR